MDNRDGSRGARSVSPGAQAPDRTVLLARMRARKVGLIRLLAVVVVVALVLLPPAPINSSGEPPPAAWEPRPDDSNPAQGRVGRGVR
jgi:hypothetical protein